MGSRGVAAIVVVVLAGGCGEPLVIGRTPAPTPTLAAPLLPASPGVFAPAHNAIEDGVTGAWVADIDSCAGCHADVFAQQQASAHAWSSFNNPIYRFAVESLRGAVGKAASRMCGGCHDIALLVDGAMDDEVSATDPRAHAGVTCRVCHGMREATVDGNGSFTLSASKIILPQGKDAASVAAHKKSAAPITGPAMCGSCHRGFLSRATGNSHFLPGMDELTGHAQSAYAGGGLGRIDRVEAKGCVACHMPRVAAPLGDAAAKGGTIASHRFTGGHTWLAQMIGDDDQLAAQRQRLEGVVSLDIAAARSGPRWSYPADEAHVIPGESLEIDVVLRNREVGHRFPAGVLDAQDVFLTLEVKDARGKSVASAGARHRAGEADDTAHILRALVADQDGQPRFARDVQHFAAVVVNHTIAPRDAAVVRYKFLVPPTATLPLSIEAALVHRSRNLIIARLACEESRSPRGRAFDDLERRDGRKPPDACVAPPQTTMATARLELSSEPPPRRDRSRDIDRLYELGMAMGHAVSERLEEARAPLEAALELAGDDGDPRARARLWAALATVAGRQGRTDEALELVARAEAAVGTTPALNKIAGDALSKVWRWREAEVVLEAATAGAPGNSGGWRALAIARGSLGDHRGALEATAAGLALSPRDADMLRVQALALRALGADDALAETALEAYDIHRPPDRAGDIKISCAKTVPACALEREPVHTHELAPASP